MSEVDKALEQLIGAIKVSEQYKEYCLQLEKVKAVPQLKEKIDEFRLRNFELQNSQDYDFNKMEEFEIQYKDLRENLLVSDFLAAELAFCRMLQEINDSIVKAVDFE